MKNVLKIFCAALLVAATVFTFASCATIDGMKQDVKDFLKDNEEEIVDEFKDEEAAAFRFNLLNSASLTLCSAEVEVVTSTALVEKQLTALVEPSTAAVEIEWEVYWITNPFGEDAVVTDYVTVSPSVDDSKVAIVGAHKAFKDAVIGVKAVTNPGGYSAVCEVSFVGEPKELLAVGIDDQDHFRIDQGHYLDMGSSLEFEVYSFNKFGTSIDGVCQIGDVNCELKLKGNITVNVTTENGTNAKQMSLTGSDDVTAEVLQSLLSNYIELIWEKYADYTGSITCNLKTGDLLVDSTYYQVTYVSGIDNVTFELNFNDNTYGTVGEVEIAFREFVDVALSDSTLTF